MSFHPFDTSKQLHEPMLFCCHLNQATNLILLLIIMIITIIMIRIPIIVIIKNNDDDDDNILIDGAKSKLVGSN